MVPLMVVFSSTRWASATSLFGSFSSDLGQVADDEGARVADAPLVDEAHVVDAERHVGGERDLELGDGRLGRRRAWSASWGRAAAAAAG